MVSLVPTKKEVYGTSATKVHPMIECCPTDANREGGRFKFNRNGGRGKSFLTCTEQPVRLGFSGVRREEAWTG